MKWTTPNEKLPKPDELITFYAKCINFEINYIGMFRDGLFLSHADGVVYDEFPPENVRAWRYLEEKK